jgi:methyl-accepting chemotaxis protein
VPGKEGVEVSLQTMLEFATRPIRWVLGVADRDVVETVRETRDIEADMLGAVHAIENATDSIERHVEVIETLATSVDPLRASVDRLTDTMQELVAILAPMAAAEHEIQRAGRFFGRHRHDDPRQEGQIKP